MRSEDISRFTDGDCHILARRVSRLTGWPCAAFVKTLPSGELQQDCHVWNIMPDGRYFDVNGPQERAEFLSRWCAKGLDVCTFTAAEIGSEWGGPYFSHYSYARARVIAERLLDMHGIER